MPVDETRKPCFACFSRVFLVPLTKHRSFAVSKSVSVIDQCIALARMRRDVLRDLFGYSARDGRTSRLAQRKRRAGAVMLARPDLEKALRASDARAPLPLRQVLIACEAIGKGQRYVY